jgi:glycosyltransferase involved in cell wall biosynthesis
MRQKALFICAHYPDASATQAGHKIAQQNLNELRQRYDVHTVLILRGAERPSPPSEPGDHLTTIVHSSGLRRLLGIAAGMLTGLPPRFAARFSVEALRLIQELLRTRSHAIVWLEFSQVFWLAPYVARHPANCPKLTLSVHDVQAELVQRKSLLERLLVLRWTRWCEGRLFRCADSIRVLSEKDRNLVRSYNPQAPIIVSPPRPSAFATSVRRSPGSVQPHSLLFWGAMNRSENYAAVIGFIEKHLPQLLREFSDATLFVVGANPPKRVRELASPHVIITGFVDDPTPYFEKASLGIVPLLQGAGVKLKTLEMLAAGLTVISTEVGAEGITPNPRLIVTHLQDIVTEISQRWREVAATSAQT